MRSTYYDPQTRGMVQLGQGPEHWLVAAVRVPMRSRGQGVASKLMRRVCRDADREGVKLTLCVAPDVWPGGLDFSALYHWYQRLGFEVWERGHYYEDFWMQRHPQTTHLHLVPGVRDAHPVYPDAA